MRTYLPEQLRKYRVSYNYLSGSPEQSQSYQASMHILAIIGPPAKHHFNGHYRPAIETPFKCRFASELMMVFRDKQISILSNNLKRLSLQLRIFFDFFYFVFKSFVKVDLSYVFTINLFTIAENCTEK